MSEGKLIVLDGLDGSGKTTQFELAGDALEKGGVKLRRISFPDYEKPSSALVKMYLRGEFSDCVDGVNAYAASSFYAVDRFASYRLYWQRDYLEGMMILASRYVSSNLIHQMVKLPQSEWNGFIGWLLDYEHEKLGLPRADTVIFLDMPVEVSQRLLEQRYCGDNSQKDIHERDTDYLRKCRKAALYAAEALGWAVIPCAIDDAPLSREDIHKRVMERIINA